MEIGVLLTVTIVLMMIVMFAISDNIDDDS